MEGETDRACSPGSVRVRSVPVPSTPFQFLPLPYTRTPLSPYPSYTPSLQLTTEFLKLSWKQ